MPLASSGLSSSMGRQAFRVIHSPPNISYSRGLHTHSFASRVAPQPSTPLTSRVLQRTRTIFNAFVGHLTAPSKLRAPGAAPRFMQTVATRVPKIENNLSLPVRHALSTRMGAPRLPRPPAVPRSIAQVGLGTARNFTTGRPIFQNIADNMHNIPVATRAFLEADLDMKTKDDRGMALKLKYRRKSKKRSSRSCAGDKAHFHPAATRPTVAAVEETEAEFDKYFVPQVPDVSTSLLIPLAPTPTTRVPLSHTFAYDRHPLVPFLELSALRVDTERHASRLRALFEQLDAAQAWDKGAVCETLGGARGASVLRVRFAGWSAHAVRGIIGEAATGWCILEEERAEYECGDRDSEPEECLSDVDSAVAADDPGIAELNLNSPIDPAYSFVLPTLDFSASAALPPITNPPSMDAAAASELRFSDMASRVSPSDVDVDIDTFSDLGHMSDGSSSGGSVGGRDSCSWIETPDDALYSSRTPSWAGLSFSSAFSRRLEDGPWEEAF